MPLGQYIASGFMYLNLGCHMMFVLKNRLKAQGIPIDKAVKIIADLIEAIFKPHFIKAVMAVQQPMSVNTLKEIFRKLAHSSIMKLDNSSMQKLIFLIVMTIKKEFFLTSSPLQIYSITLGNLQTLHQYVKEVSSGNLLKEIIEHYQGVASNYRFMEYYQLREYVLSVLQPLQTKVVNFAESGLQNDKGKLIFIKRNHHNDRPIGTGTSGLVIVKNKTDYFPLKTWRDWKTSLIMDYAKQYEKQSQRRNAKNQNNSQGKQKSLNDLFNLGTENLNDFEVKIELFGYEQKQIRTSKKIQKQQQGQSTATTTKIQQKSQTSKLRGRIEQQFKQVNKDANEEIDLLDMMDN